MLSTVATPLQSLQTACKQLATRLRGESERLRSAVQRAAELRAHATQLLQLLTEELRDERAAEEDRERQRLEVSGLSAKLMDEQKLLLRV